MSCPLWAHAHNTCARNTPVRARTWVVCCIEQDHLGARFGQC